MFDEDTDLWMFLDALIDRLWYVLQGIGIAFAMLVIYLWNL